MLNRKLMCLLLIIPVAILLLMVFRNDVDIPDRMESLAIAISMTTFGIGLLLGAWTQSK